MKTDPPNYRCDFLQGDRSKGKATISARLIFMAFLAGVLFSNSGCQTATWNGPEFVQPLPIVEISTTPFSEIESVYARATVLEDSGNAECVDRYFETARQCWHQLNANGWNNATASTRVWELYHSSLAKVISTSQEYRRFDPIQGIEIQTQHGSERIPVQYHGFLWSPEDFNEIVLVGQYQHKHLPKTYRSNGLGVPLVVNRKRPYDEPLRKRKQSFAATVILKPLTTTNDLGTEADTFALEFYSPASIDTIELPDAAVAIARDMTAPFAYVLDTKGNIGFEAFRSIGSSANATGLYTITPYQPGKIPLIFVHGLLSDPTTWVAMASELLADPEFASRYQIWAFEYQTGDAFLRSGKTFRNDLMEARELLDPDHLDSALDHIVVIGHSMGGLVAKIQITASHEMVWESFSTKPFEEIVASERASSALADISFFEPNLSIERVIFIGTPHRGANSAQRIGGSIASALVKEPKERKAQHRKLVKDNPGAFRREVRRHIPTSIDLLQPNSHILQAVEKLPVSPYVRLHTIMGDKGFVFGHSSDGVVPLTSAHHPGANSELVVHANHTQLQSTPEAIEEVTRILRLHLRSLD